MTFFNPGDHVYLGEAGPDEVHWVVQHIDQADTEHTYATIRSPFSGRTQVVPVERLTPHTFTRLTEHA